MTVELPSEPSSSVSQGTGVDWRAGRRLPSATGPVLGVGGTVVVGGGLAVLGGVAVGGGVAVRGGVAIGPVLWVAPIAAREGRR